MPYEEEEGFPACILQLIAKLVKAVCMFKTRRSALDEKKCRASLRSGIHSCEL
jgi:hypothetical protein